MQGKKIYIVLIVIFVVFFLVMFLTYGVQNLEREKDEATFIIGNHTVWHYENKKWVSIDSSSFEDLNWKEFTVYLNQKNIGKYSFWYDDNWYAFDSEKNPITLNDDLFAFQANYEISILSFKEELIDSYSVGRYLESKGIKSNSQLTSSSKVSIDFDSDGIREDFYTITNAFALDFQTDVIFSFVFMVKDGKFYTIYENIDNSYYDACKPYFTSFVNVNRDLPYEVVLSCGGFSLENEKRSLYEFLDGQFRLVISN